MTRAVIGEEKVRIEGQSIDISGMIYTKMLGASLISVIYVSAVFRISKRKYYTLSKHYYYSKRLDWTLSIYLHTVTKSIWWLLKMTFLNNQKLELCVIRIPKPWPNFYRKILYTAMIISNV